VPYGPDAASLTRAERMSSLRSTLLEDSMVSISLRAACAISALATGLRVRSLPSKETLRITSKWRRVHQTKEGLTPPGPHPKSPMTSIKCKRGHSKGTPQVWDQGFLKQTHLLAAETEVHKTAMKAIARNTRHRGMLIFC